jgi:ribosomal protein L37AE/L43A/DNA-directed RNA polymerase subunit RPC12/RpoP
MPNNKSSETTSTHRVLQCRVCGLKTLVEIREEWYECSNRKCNASGNSPESVFRLEIKYAQEQTGQSETVHTKSLDHNVSQLYRDRDLCPMCDTRLSFKADVDSYFCARCDEYWDRRTGKMWKKDASYANSEQNVREEEHPPRCACADCTLKRLMSNHQVGTYPVEQSVPIKTLGQSEIAASIPLRSCPECHHKSLFQNENNDRYECLYCRESFAKVLIERDEQIVEAQKNAIDAIDAKDTKAWVGNRWWNPKKKRWEDGEHLKIVRHLNWMWIIVPLVFILISLTVSLILNHFHPGSKFWIFGW